MMEIKKFSWEEIKGKVEDNVRVHRTIRRIAEEILKRKDNELVKKVVEKILESDRKTTKRSKPIKRPKVYTPFQIFTSLLRGGNEKAENLAEKILIRIKVAMQELELPEEEFKEIKLYIPFVRNNMWFTHDDQEVNIHTVDMQWEWLKQLLNFGNYHEIPQSFKLETSNWKTMDLQRTYVFYAIRPEIFFPISWGFESLFEQFKPLIEHFSKIDFKKEKYWDFMDWFWDRGREVLWREFIDPPKIDIPDKEFNIALNIALQENVKKKRSQEILM